MRIDDGEVKGAIFGRPFAAGWRFFAFLSIVLFMIGGILDNL